MGACRLNRRSGTGKLPASTVAGSAGAETEVLTAWAEGLGDGDWRILDLWSDEGSPWEARIAWSGGGGALRTAYVDVPKCTRVCVHATNLQVFGSNLSTSAEVQARAAIADGQCDTENQWTVRGGNTQVAAPTTEDLDPPPWARFVRLELSDHTLLPSATVELLDVNATSRGQYSADAQPAPGAPLGDAHTVRLTLPAGSYGWRAVFLLHL